MADNFIDKYETQVYGDYARKKIEEIVMGLVPAFNPALDHVQKAIETATANVRKLLERSHRADLHVIDHAPRKRERIEDAVSLLVRFGRHLGAHEPGAVNPRQFFVADGTVRGIGKSERKVMAGMSHVIAELKKKDCPVEDAQAWLKRFTAVAEALAPAVEEVDRARTARRGSTPELREARADWLRTYSSAKSVVSAVLAFAGKPELLPRVFYDLAVPSGTRLHAPPEPSLPPA